MTNFEESENRIKLTFSKIVPLILQQLKIELKCLQYSAHTIALSKSTILTRKCRFLAKKPKKTTLTSAKLQVLGF